MKMSLPAFCKKYGIGIRVFYKLFEASSAPNFAAKVGDRWTVDDKAPGVKDFVKKYGGTPSRSDSEQPATTEQPDALRRAKEEKIIQGARTARLKADQEEIKTRKMMGEYIDVGLMRYYFGYFQRAINDSFAFVKTISPNLKRLYAADKDREAESLIKTELGIAYGRAIKMLELEIEKDCPDDAGNMVKTAPSDQISSVIDTFQKPPTREKFSPKMRALRP